MKRYKIQTLIDITETGARRTDGSFLYGQQSNYNAVIQTVGLRVNPIVESLIINEVPVGKLGFGSMYKGKQMLWELSFLIEYEGAITLDTLKEDFDLVPVVTNLSETAEINTQVFRTTDSNLTNIVFTELDK